MSGWWQAVALGIGAPLLILLGALVIGVVQEIRAREADPGPLRPLLRGWYARLGVERAGDRIAELRIRIGDRGRQQWRARIGRRPRP